MGYIHLIRARSGYQARIFFHITVLERWGRTGGGRSGPPTPGVQPPYPRPNFSSLPPPPFFSCFFLVPPPKIPIFAPAPRPSDPRPLPIFRQKPPYPRLPNPRAPDPPVLPTERDQCRVAALTTKHGKAHIHIITTILSLYYQQQWPQSRPNITSHYEPSSWRNV